MDEGSYIYQAWLWISQKDSAFWAAIGQIATAIIAAVTIPTLISQMRSAKSTSEVQTLIEFYRNIDILEDKLLNSEKDTINFAFIDYVNFLEIFAGLTNSGTLHKTSGKFVTKKIVSALAIIEISDTFRDMLEKAVDTPSTFYELRDFRKRNRKEIDNEIAVRKMLISTDDAKGHK